MRLDIAVHDVVPVRVIERRQDAQRHGDRLPRRDAAHAANQILERLPAHEFHHDVGYPIEPHIEHVHNVLVRHLRRRLGLVAKAAHEFLVALEFRAQQLYRHLPARLLVQRAVHDRHAACADDFYELIPA